MSAWECPKMMPGETPYTHEEWKKLQKLLRGAAAVDDALTAEEMDELERDLEKKKSTR